MKGRHIHDVFLIAKKCLEEYRLDKKGLALKLFLEKAFDMVRQDFREFALVCKGFWLKWRNWVMGCISAAHSSDTNQWIFLWLLWSYKMNKARNPPSLFLFTVVVYAPPVDWKSLQANLFSRISNRERCCNRFLSSVHWRHCYLSMLMLWGSTTLHTSSTALKWYLGWRLIGQKSSLSGIGILAAEGADFANTIGCSWYKDWPIIYLGLPGAIPFQRDSGSLC